MYIYIYIYIYIYTYIHTTCTVYNMHSVWCIARCDWFHEYIVPKVPRPMHPVLASSTRM